MRWLVIVQCHVLHQRGAQHMHRKGQPCHVVPRHTTSVPWSGTGTLHASWLIAQWVALARLQESAYY